MANCFGIGQWTFIYNTAALYFKSLNTIAIANFPVTILKGKTIPFVGHLFPEVY